ncbi:MAG: hypothetical protein ACI4RD_02145 [Kiritimatiellia bacterium]
MTDTRAFSRASHLVLAGLLTLAGSVRADFANKQNLMFQFAFDGVGVCPQSADLSGNGYQAIVSNNVWGCRTTNARCFSGFTTTTSSFVVTNAVASRDRSCTAVAWVRNINFESKLPHVLFRAGGGKNGSAAYDGYNSDNAWQVTIATNGAVVIGMQTWAGASTNNANAAVPPQPVAWQPDVWYQVAVTVRAITVSGVRNRELAVYVTPQGGAAVGEPVSRLENASAAGFGSSRNFVVGAARNGYGTYKESIAGGYFDGEISGVTVFDRVVTAEELANDLATFQMTWHPVDAYADFHWNLNETGDLPVAVDATGNGIDGTTVGGVSGGGRAPQGTAYRGFSSTGDKLYGSGFTFEKGSKNELLLWVRRPEASNGRTALLAGSMSNVESPRDTQPWRVSVGEDGAVSIAMQTWRGFTLRTTGKPYAWGKDWHLVSVRFDCPTRLLWSESDGVTNWTDGVCNRIVVSAAPAAKEGGRMQVLAEASIPVYNSLLPDVKNLVFGSVGEGFYREFSPASVLGDGGRLAEVMYKSSGWFDTNWASALLPSYCVTPSGAALLVR